MAPTFDLQAHSTASDGELPPREVILAMLLSAVNAPATQLVGAINAPARDIVSLLGNWIDKRKEAGETE